MCQVRYNQWESWDHLLIRRVYGRLRIHRLLFSFCMCTMFFMGVYLVHTCTEILFTLFFLNSNYVPSSSHSFVENALYWFLKGWPFTESQHNWSCCQWRTLRGSVNCCASLWLDVTSGSTTSLFPPAGLR